MKLGNQVNVTEPCDKGRVSCIITTKDYFTKSHTHLQDHNTYKSLTLNPAKAIVTMFTLLCTICIHNT